MPPNVYGLIAYFVDRDSNSHKMLIKSLYSTGGNKERAHLQNDKYNGLFERWYSTGEKWRETSYLNDKIISKKHWDKNGKLYIKTFGLYPLSYDSDESLIEANPPSGTYKVRGKRSSWIQE